MMPEDARTFFQGWLVGKCLNPNPLNITNVDVPLDLDDLYETYFTCDVQGTRLRVTVTLEDGEPPVTWPPQPPAA